MNLLHHVGPRLLSPHRPITIVARTAHSTIFKDLLPENEPAESAPAVESEASTSNESHRPDLVAKLRVHSYDRSLPPTFPKALPVHDDSVTDSTSPPKLATVVASEHAISRSGDNTEKMLHILRSAIKQKAVQGGKNKKKKKKKKGHEDVSGSSSKNIDGQLRRRKDSATDAPSQNKSTSQPRQSPLHTHTPLDYTRRIEGLLHSLDTNVLQNVDPPTEQRPVAKLAHGLDRVLFNPGVHWLQDPRSRVYNFSTWLELIPDVKDFAFERVSQFVKSSRDQDLWALCKQEKRTFGGSTSSLTGMLSHIYFLISGDKEVDTSTLSRHFAGLPTNFTAGQRMPVSVIFNYNDGAYAIDSDSIPGESDRNILVWLGTLLEKFFTVPQEEFIRLLRSSPDSPETEEDPRREAFRFSKSTRFVMRSQLDAQDSRLPGTGVFDIKTRAALPIRLDSLNYVENSGYAIRHQQGLMESFEREYYDLIRSAFLKYSFQARIGAMDGVFVAYHNTERIFGFQYIPLEEMDARLFGKPGLGDRVFEKCVGVMEQVADEVARVFPEQSVRATFETLKSSHTMNVWIEPLERAGEGERPIAMLEVTADSYLVMERVSGTHAVGAADVPWTMHWAISQSSRPADKLRALLASAKERATRAYNFPAGVDDLEEMETRWQEMRFGADADADADADAERGAEFDASAFRAPDRSVQRLRKLAQQGRVRTEAEARLLEGKRKVVWGALEEGPVLDSLLDPTAISGEVGEPATGTTDGADSMVHSETENTVGGETQVVVEEAVTESILEGHQSETMSGDNTSSGDPYLARRRENGE